MLRASAWRTDGGGAYRHPRRPARFTYWSQCTCLLNWLELPGPTRSSVVSVPRNGAAGDIDYTPDNVTSCEFPVSRFPFSSVIRPLKLGPVGWPVLGSIGVTSSWTVSSEVLK